jgi:hypothetical protein
MVHYTKRADALQYEEPTLATPEQVAEFFGELPTYPKGPDYTSPALATADALFGVLGFRRVTDG